MKIFVPPNGHANKYTIPLRFGLVLRKEDCWSVLLENAEFDKEGTENQTKSDREKGRKHYIGVLKFSSPDSGIEIETEIRAVLEMPTSADKLPLLKTVLGVHTTKGDNTISRFLEGLHQKGRISTEDIRTIFHRAYSEGRISDANDVQDIYEQEIKSQATIDANEPKLQSNPEILTEATRTPSVEELDLHAPMISKPLLIPGVKLTYVMANAYIENVRVENDMIKFDFINSDGQPDTIHSFRLSTRPYLKHLHKHAYDYFKDREEQRAMFAVCTNDHCFGFLAESVTAISLQMMRAGKA